MADLKAVIEQAFENRASITPRTADAAVREAVDETIAQLDSGAVRVSEKSGSEWITHQWLKKAVLLSFRLADNEVIRDGYTNYFDKVDSKFATYGDADFKSGGFRVVPPAAVRRGAFIAKNVVLMPSYVNLGAWVGGGGTSSSRQAASTTRKRKRLNSLIIGPLGMVHVRFARLQPATLPGPGPRTLHHLTHS